MLIYGLLGVPPQVLSSVPPTWALPTISTFLTRSFRRSQHVAHEEMIIKGLSWGQNLRVSDRAFTIIRGQGGIIAESTESPEPVEDPGTGVTGPGPGTGTGFERGRLGRGSGERLQGGGRGGVGGYRRDA